MRKRTVRSGLIWTLGGVVLITLATFYHSHIATFFLLSGMAETLFIFIGLIIGGIACFAGIMISFVGMLRRNGHDGEVRIAHFVILLTAAISIFFFLFFISIADNNQPDMGPGEIITI
jgi:hypothetical protein